MKNPSPIHKKTAQESFADIGKQLTNIAKRLSVYAGFSYLVFLLLAITASAFLVTQGLAFKPTGNSSQLQNNDFSLSFDQATIKRVTAPTTAPTTPAGRTNPFAE